MGKVTYPDSRVIEFLNSTVVPLMVASDAQPYATQWRVKWTPSLFIMEEGQVSVQYNVGFLPPDELIPWVLLGLAKLEFLRDRFPEALQRLEGVLGLFPQSGSAPEAVYLRGVCGYKHTQTAEPLKEAFRKLQADYPASLWAKRASPYGLL